MLLVAVPIIIDWYRNYRHHNRGVHWYYKPGIDNDHAHGPALLPVRKINIAACYKNKKTRY